MELLAIIIGDIKRGTHSFIFRNELLRVFYWYDDDDYCGWDGWSDSVISTTLPDRKLGRNWTCTAGTEEIYMYRQVSMFVDERSDMATMFGGITDKYMWSTNPRSTWYFRILWRIIRMIMDK